MSCDTQSHQAPPRELVDGLELITGCYANHSAPWPRTRTQALAQQEEAANAPGALGSGAGVGAAAAGALGAAAGAGVVYGSEGLLPLQQGHLRCLLQVGGPST